MATYMIVTIDSISAAAFAVGWLSLLAMDFVWLGVVAKWIDAYARMAKDVPTKYGIAAILGYTVLVSLAASALKFGSAVEAGSFGAFAGGIVFASYNITTLAVDKRWSVIGAAIDTMYGIVSWSVMFIVMCEGYWA
jgi:uncharacterized membrane protein